MIINGRFSQMSPVTPNPTTGLGYPSVPEKERLFASELYNIKNKHGTRKIFYRTGRVTKGRERIYESRIRLLLSFTFFNVRHPRFPLKVSRELGHHRGSRTQVFNLLCRLVYPFVRYLTGVEGGRRDGGRPTSGGEKQQRDLRGSLPGENGQDFVMGPGRVYRDPKLSNVVRVTVKEIRPKGTLPQEKDLGSGLP